MQGPTPAAEPAAEPPQHQKKPGSARARKATTPRSRAKKPADGKKAATPRRRASPRNRKAVQDAEQKKKEKDKEKEKNKDEKENTVETVQAAPTVVASSSLPTVKEENDGEEGGDMKQEAKVEKTEMGNQQEAESGEELPPAQDTQLRRTYLQRMYRQLQSTHPNQDDAMIRQIATNVEMEACQKSATRSQYVAAMDHEIHKLMQFELEQANAPVYTNDAAQSYQSEQSATVQGQQPTVSSEMQSEYSQNQISQSHSYEYAQALAKAQEQEQANNSARSSSFSTPRQSMNSGDMSFQSLMDNQSQGGYGRDSMQQQQQQNTPTRLMSMQNLQMGNQYYSTSSTTTPTSQSYSVQSNVSEMAGQNVPRNMMEAHQHQQLGNYQMQQQMHTPGSMRPPSRVTTFQEFTAQIQHLDKSVLIELLWNQRSALARWQNHAKQLELQVSAHQTAASHMGSSPGFQSPYNSPVVGGAAFVSPNIAAEAEMQRARERNSSRMPQLPRHQQQQQQMPQYPSYSQQSTPSSATYSQADGSWGDNNPPLYWQRIRQLKTEYEEQLRTAQRALAQNTVPPNSMYSAKAQSMMQNITMVLNILNEPPTNVQPRKFEVLSSIEHFMHQSVTPIVRKVLSSGATVSPAAVTAGSSPSMTTSVATFSPSAPLSQGSVVGMSSSFRQGSDNQYNGARWASSNPSFSEGDTSRQHSRGIFADVDAGDANGSTRMMDGLTAVGNSPCNATYEPTGYAQVRAENDTQSDTSMGQSMVYEAPSMTLKESSALSLPALESRPSTIPDSRLSPDDPGNARDSNSSKVMDSASVDDDFSDFPVLEFEDPVADGNSFVKENNPSNVSRKRGIEDV